MKGQVSALAGPGIATRQATPEDDHFFRVEVTIAACVATPDHRALGDNIVDVTFGFSASMARPPAGITDEQINATLSHHISPVAAAIQVTLTSLGYAALGTIDEPMTEHSTATGELGVATPVTVQISMSAAPEARAS